jgi:hypothetical protein
MKNQNVNPEERRSDQRQFTLENPVRNIIPISISRRMNEPNMSRNSSAQDTYASLRPTARQNPPKLAAHSFGLGKNNLGKPDEVMQDQTRSSQRSVYSTGSNHQQKA